MASMCFLFPEKARGGRPLVQAAAAFCLLLTATLAAATEPPSAATVREDKGVYTVAATFLVPQPPSIVLAVLTDYEQIPRFMPGVRSSLIRERTSGKAVVEQEATSSLLMFTKRVHLVLEIDEQVDALLFRDRCGRSFTHYEGAWRVVEEGGQTTIRYQLTARPSFEVPGVLLKRLLRRDAGQMIERLRQEIAARAAAPAAPRSSR